MTASNRKRAKEPDIVVPKPTDDQPRYGRVAVIAAVGFVVGLAWPALARVQLAPVPPADTLSSEVAATNSAETTAAPPVASSAAKAPDLAQGAAPAPVVVGPKVRLADILSCVDADGRKRHKCDAPAFDSVLVEPLKGLLACDGADGVSGVLSLGFDIDLTNGKLGHFTVGRSTTLEPALARSLAECAKGKLPGVDAASVEHGYASYRVFYLLEFTRSAVSGRAGQGGVTPPGGEANAPATSAEGELQGQSGRATVAWDVAIVRKAPKDGAILARVLGGTRVLVTGRQGDWYRIKYNAKGDEGFVFKSAIGL